MPDHSLGFRLSFPYVSTSCNREEKDLLITVNKAGSSTGETLRRAYQFLTSIIKENNYNIGRSKDETDIFISGGHKSRFNSSVMDHCNAKNLEQFILPPDTSGVIHKHDQMNQILHSTYESKKSTRYTEYSDINKECFMNIQAEVWTDWAKPEKIKVAAKR